MHHVRALGRKEHQDGEQQADQGPGGREADEDVVVEPGAEEAEEHEAGQHGGAEGDAEEHADAGGDGGVRDVDSGAAGGEDLDEEQGQGGEEDDLQEGVDGDEDGAVVAAAAGLEMGGVRLGGVDDERLAGGGFERTMLFQIRTMAMQRAMPTRIRP